jgi:pimeloyl-ACP methyl ester carboxylesterase
VGIVCEPQSESSPVEATAPRPLKTTASSATFTLHAVFEIYRAFPQNVRVNQAQHQRNDVPVFFGAGERSPFSKLMPRIVAALRASGLTHVDSGVVPGARHYVVQDAPERVADLIERQAVPRR